MPEKNYTKLKITSIVLLFIGLSLVLMGFQITWKAISNTTSDYCTANANCSNGKVCCITPIKSDFYMCYELETCINLKDNLKAFLNESSAPTGATMGRYKSEYMALGIAITALAIFILILTLLKEKKGKKKARSKLRHSKT